MKLKYIIASLVAGAALLTACQKEADTYLSDIKVDKSIVGFPKEGGSKDIVVTATADWIISISEDDAEWLSVSPATGTIGETIPEAQYSRSLFSGKALVVIKTNGKPGTITLSAQSDGLKDAKISIK